jgi:hypothetical protein
MIAYIHIFQPQRPVIKLILGSYALLAVDTVCIFRAAEPLEIDGVSVSEMIFGERETED